MAYKIIVTIKENFVSGIIFHNGMKINLSPYDISIAQKWKFPCDISLPVTKGKASREDVWKYHLDGWVEVNFDVDAKGNLRPVGCGE